jgi:hypothetical protein
LLNLLNKQKENFYICLLLSIGLYITYFQIFGFDLNYIIGDLGDSRFISSIVEYNYQWMIGNYDKYWDGFFMYPDKEVISYSDNLLGSLPFYAIFRLLGANHLTAYQLLILLSHLLNFIGAYYCFYKVTGNKFAAATGAFIFAFNLSVNSIHNHPQFTFRFMAPLAFYAIFNYLQTYRNKFLYYFVLFLSFQFYLSIYLGYFLLVFIAIFAIIYFCFNRDKVKLTNLKTASIGLISSACLFLVMVLPLFYHYYQRNQITGYYTSYQEILETVPQLKSYLIPFASAYSFDFLKDITVESKYGWFHQLFPGTLVFLSSILSVYFGIKRKNKLQLSLLFVLVFFLIFATNFNGNSLYSYLQEIPGFSAIRVVSRFVLLSTFIYGWLMALNLNEIKSETWKNTLLLLFPLLLFYDNYCEQGGFGRFEKREALNRIETIATKIALQSKPGSDLVFAYIPKTEEESFKVQIDAMQTAVYLKAKTINGYSSSCHGEFGPFWEKHDSLSLSNWCKVFKLDESKLVIVN